MQHRRWRRVLGLLLLPPLAGLAAWQIAAELVEPHWLLYVGDWLRPAPDPIEVATAGGTFLRLYADTRPHIGKIAGLQKGLVWVVQGAELVEEGYGFGCPIVEIDGRAYLASHAETEISHQEGSTRITKQYTLDTIDAPPRFMQRKFRRVPSPGIVTVHYDVDGNGTIEVEVDFAGLHVPWDRAYLMNEQGAHHFTRYQDASGLVLNEHEIGIWQPTNVERACFGGDGGDVQFCVEPIDEATIYYGRERYNVRNWRGFYYLSWSGIDVEVTGPRRAYRYRLVLKAP